MREFFGWMIVLGLVLDIVCVFMRSSQLEKHRRSMIEVIVHSNQIIMARLDRLANSAVQASEPAVGAVFDRRRAQRRDPLARMGGKPGEVEQRASLRRRVDDVLST